MKIVSAIQITLKRYIANVTLHFIMDRDAKIIAIKNLVIGNYNTRTINDQNEENLDLMMEEIKR